MGHPSSALSVEANLHSSPPAPAKYRISEPLKMLKLYTNPNLSVHQIEEPSFLRNNSVVLITSTYVRLNPNVKMFNQSGNTLRLHTPSLMICIIRSALSCELPLVPCMIFSGFNRLLFKTPTCELIP